MEKMYDERGFIKPEYVPTDQAKKAMLFNNDIEKIDNRANFNDTAYFLTCDGKKCATMEEVIAYNKAYYDRLMIRRDLPEKNDMHR